MLIDDLKEEEHDCDLYLHSGDYHETYCCECERLFSDKICKEHDYIHVTG